MNYEYEWEFSDFFYGRPPTAHGNGLCWTTEFLNGIDSALEQLVTGNAAWMITCKLHTDLGWFEAAQIFLHVHALHMSADIEKSILETDNKNDWRRKWQWL
jgi:hypothetical protein